jgi:hypothetical protein
VQHTVVVTNTGNVQLRDIMVTTTLTTNNGANTVSGPTSYSCNLVGGPTTTLLSPGTLVPQGGVLTCTATYTFTAISTIEAGNLRLDTSVAAASVTAQTDQKTVTVHQLPQLVVSADSTDCVDPNPNDESEYRVAWDASDSLHIALRVSSFVLRSCNTPLQIGC